MKIFKNTRFALGATLLAGVIMTTSSCKDDDDGGDGTNEPTKTTYTQEDQMGRPAINTVLVNMADKNTFNTTIPSEMQTAFQAKFETKLSDTVVGLNPAYTTNALGHDATTFSTILSNDALGVKTSGPTTFFDGTNVLTGRALADDVVDVELILIFGGPDALTGNPTNPGLISDGVAANDKTFLTSFPYLAEPH